MSIPVDSTSTVIDTTNSADTTQSGNPASISSISSLVIPASTFSPISSTSDLFSPTPSIFYPSISAISLSGISATFNPTSTSVGDQTITVTSVVETGVHTPQDTSFGHQTGAIIGVAFAGAFILLFIILLILFACKLRRSNRLHNSSMEDMLAVSRNASWRPPLERDDEYFTSYERFMSPNTHLKSLGSQGHGGAGFFDSRGGSAESARMPPICPTLHRSMNSRGPCIYPSYSSHDTSRPWWRDTEPLNIVKHNNSQRPPLTLDLQSGSRSTSSLGLGVGSSSNGYHGPGSSGDALLTRGNTRKTSINEPRDIHRLSGRRHYSTPFMLARDSSLEYGAQRIQQHQEEQKQRDCADKSISQIILARLRASRRLSTAPTVEAYSQCTTIKSEESAPSREPSYLCSSSLLNPPISMSQTVPRLYLPRDVTGSSDNTLHQLPYRVGDTCEGSGVTFPPAPSPVPSNMIEGLLHPRLGMALAQSQQASATSLRDHEDYTRPINGLVNNHIRSTTTFETQDTVDLGEGRV